MLGFEIREKLPGWPDLHLFHVFETLTHAFGCIGLCGNVEQTLIGLGILHDSYSLPFDSEHYRRPKGAGAARIARLGELKVPVNVGPPGALALGREAAGRLAGNGWSTLSFHQPVLDAIEVEINHRGSIQRQHLTDD